MKIETWILYKILRHQKYENFIFIDGATHSDIEDWKADDDDTFTTIFQDLNTEKYYRAEYSKWHIHDWHGDLIECEEVFPHEKTIIVFENFKQY